MEFIQLTANIQDATARITINGFPLRETKEGILSLPLDLYLLPDNTLTVQVTPTGKGHVTLTVQRVPKGMMVSTDDNSPGLINLDTDISQEKTFEYTFKTPDKTLGKRLQGEPMNAQEALTYAKQLAILLGKKADVTLEFQPKFEDYAVFSEESLKAISDGFMPFLNQFKLEYDPSKITVKQCTPRIFELLYDNHAFIAQGNFKIDVYIGKVNGEVKVVR